MSYRIDFLPIDRQHMIDTAQYISDTLGNPSAALRLADEMEAALERTSSFPYANPVYAPIRPLSHEYRKSLVGNFLILYWVDEPSKTVTVARVVYSRRDVERLL